MGNVIISLVIGAHVGFVEVLKLTPNDNKHDHWLDWRLVVGQQAPLGMF